MVVLEVYMYVQQKISDIEISINFLNSREIFQLIDFFKFCCSQIQCN